MVDFDKFDDQIDVAEVNKKVKEAKDSGSFDDVPNGLPCFFLLVILLPPIIRDCRVLYAIFCGT